MKAIVFDEYGDASVLKMADVAIPEPKDDEILIKNYASGLNPLDWKLRSGQMAKFMPLKFPAISGMEPAGIVERVGKNVTTLQVGDHVIGFQAVPDMGSYSAYSIVKDTSAAKIPNNMKFEIGATIPVTGITAYQALFGSLKVKSGDRVLIQGGAGAVALFAIQLAKNAGATVYAAASPDHNDFLKKIGATAVYDYHDAAQFSKLEKFDKILNVIGGRNFEDSFALVKPGGVIVTTNGNPGNQEDKVASAKYGIHALSFRAQVNPQDLATLIKAVSDGQVVPAIDSIYDFKLADVQAAQNLSQAGHVTGKIVIKING